MAIEDWMGNLRRVLERVEGVRQVHTFEDLPAAMTVTPSMVVLPARGTATGFTAGTVMVHRVQVTLYVTNTILPEGWGRAVAMIDAVLQAILSDITLGGRVTYCLPDEEEGFYEGPGAINYLYGEVRFVGVVFRLEVKENYSLTIS